jgi:PAS domain S-box-containing protein
VTPAKRRKPPAESIDQDSPYRAVLDSTADGILVVDRQGKMVIWNRQFAEMWRLPETVMRTGEDDVALAAVLKQLVDPEQFLGKVRALYDSPEEESFDVLTFKDGRVFERYSKPQRIGREVSGRVWSFRDVTEHTRAEAALREAEARYSLVSDNIVDVIWTTDFNLHVTYVSPSIQRFSGYAPQEFLGLPLERLFTPASLADARRNLAEALAENAARGKVGGRTLDVEVVRKNGTTVWTELKISFLRDRDGVARGILGVARDISERRRAEDVLKETVQRLSLQSAVMEAAANAIVITGPDGTIQWVNPAFTALTGYTETEAIGKNPRILGSGRQSKEFYGEMWQTILAGQVWSGEVVNRRKDGSLYTERMTITPVKEHDGRTTHFVAIKEDVTARKEMGERLRQAQRLEAVGRLAGGVAHDFNNLLQAMLGLTQLARAQGEDLSNSPERLAELEELLHRGARLTQQLLLFSRREEPKVERFELNRAIRETATLLRRLLPANVTLQLELLPEPLHVAADRGQIGQVWMNLAVNAADAMPDGGRLAVRSGRDGENHVWFSVTDTGHGITDDIRDHIFEPFFTTKSANSGTGLGLAVVHGIVTQHGGRVDVASAAGAGATFKVVLPRGQGDAAASDGERPASPALPQGAGERVLLVEDNASVRRTFERLLKRLGYEVTSAASAEEAEGLAMTQAFSLLLTDMMLPGLSGADLAERLRQRWPRVRVILMSGYTDDEEIRRRAAHGALRFLPKPVDLETLAQEVHAALGEGST